MLATTPEEKVELVADRGRTSEPSSYRPDGAGLLVWPALAGTTGSVST